MPQMLSERLCICRVYRILLQATLQPAISNPPPQVHAYTGCLKKWFLVIAFKIFLCLVHVYIRVYIGYQGMSRDYRKCFCVQRLYYSPYQPYNRSHNILRIKSLIDMSSYCKSCRECRVHCVNTKTFHVVP